MTSNDNDHDVLYMMLKTDSDATDANNDDDVWLLCNINVMHEPCDIARQSVIGPVCPVSIGLYW